MKRTLQFIPGPDYTIPINWESTETLDHMYAQDRRTIAQFLKSRRKSNDLSTRVPGRVWVSRSRNGGCGVGWAPGTYHFHIERVGLL